MSHGNDVANPKLTISDANICLARRVTVKRLILSPNGFGLACARHLPASYADPTVLLGQVGSKAHFFP
jgi:hypothetical protein